VTLAGTDWDAALQGDGATPSLLQSWGYGETQTDEGWQVERVELPECRAQVLLQGVPGLRWAYVPRGPFPASMQSTRALINWAKERRLVRLRLEPEAPAEFGEALRAAGFRPGPAMHPLHTQIVPLGPEESMLALFKPKHRYNVRLALRRGVEVQAGDDVEELYRQHAHTAARQAITGLSLAHYRRRIERLPWCRVYVARVEGEPVAAIMVSRFGGRAYYLFGGSSGRHRELMPTYALQWEAMRSAASDGCHDYDLWGLPPSGDSTDHPWHGLWQMKTGFGGRQVSYCGAWDLVLSQLGERLADPGGRAMRVVSRLVKRN
jgi:Acetyltransferase (GNAT) domain